MSVSAATDDSGEFHDPFAAKDAAQRLVTYYRKQNKREEVKRVIALFGKGVIDAAKDVNELMASAWLKDAFDFAASSKDKDTADRLAVAMRAKVFNIKDKGQTFKWEQSVDPELVEKFLLELLEGEEDEALHRILGHYIPDWNQTQEQVLDFAKKFVFTAFIPQTIVDPSGREIATVGSVEDDLDGRITRQISQNMTYVVDFLYMALKRWIDKFAVTPERLCERLLSCPVFTPDSKTALNRGIHAYYEGDHITAVHVLIPQIESAFRAFLIGGGVSIYRQNRYGGIDFRTLGDMIADNIVKDILGENVQHYLQVLLVDPRGWNLRNTVCHGLVDASIYVQPHSDRIVHVMLILSQLKLKTPQESEGSPK